MRLNRECLHKLPSKLNNYKQSKGYQLNANLNQESNSIPPRIAHHLHHDVHRERSDQLFFPPMNMPIDQVKRLLLQGNSIQIGQWAKENNIPNIEKLIDAASDQLKKEPRKQ